ncbi:SRPBCC family protein [Paucisalibacillus sp. EB02]|uniref:SRPBCC family protein n=1 Tax=Paucisalibacillus sp. EB02 TaxID=1347087 RepID=UPI0005AB79DC|nr:SRPBCC family protein [Paucisalibacillus sp. EB02]
MDTQVTTKMKINKSANEVFEAFIDPVKIGNYWFSSSSERWEKGKKIILRYDEYGAEGIINVLEVQVNKQIVFSWGELNEETIVTITLKEVDEKSTIIEVNESGLKEEDPEVISKMLGQKEGWVYMLSCLKSYLEHDVKDLRASLVH